MNEQILTDSSEQPFTHHEVEYLLNLLEEYSKKLNDRSEKWHRLRTKTNTTFLFIALVSVLSLLATIWIYFTQPYDRPAASMTLIAFFGLIVGATVWRVQKIRDAQMESDNIALLRGVVEKLVRRSSQFEDHGRVDFTHKIAFDLRLVEAEVALKISAVPARHSHKDTSDELRQKHQ
jgi:uncharacterized membrane protein YqjE